MGKRHEFFRDSHTLPGQPASVAALLGDGTPYGVERVLLRARFIDD